MLRPGYGQVVRLDFLWCLVMFGPGFYGAWIVFADRFIGFVWRWFKVRASCYWASSQWCWRKSPRCSFPKRVLHLDSFAFHRHFAGQTSMGFGISEQDPTCPGLKLNPYRHLLAIAYWSDMDIVSFGLHLSFAWRFCFFVNCYFATFGSLAATSYICH